MPTPFLLKNIRYYCIPGVNKRFHAFPKGISPKVNVIAQLNFELAYYDIVVQYISLNTTDQRISLEENC